MTQIDPARPERTVSRRRALVGAAWTAPAIVVVAAAPAHATSTGPSALTIRPEGTASFEATNSEGEPCFDLVFTGLSVLVPAGVEPGQLTLSVTFAPTPGGDAGLLVYGHPDGWAVTPEQGVTDTVLLTFQAGLEPGGEAVLEGDHLGTASPASRQTGAFVLSATAPGHSAAALTFATGPAPAPGRRPGATTYVRPNGA